MPVSDAVYGQVYASVYQNAYSPASWLVTTDNGTFQVLGRITFGELLLALLLLIIAGLLAYRILDQVIDRGRYW